MNKEQLKERNQKIVEEYINTPNHLKNLTKLAKKFGLKQSQSVSKILKDAGVNIYNTSQHTCVDETVFDIIDSEEKAYWLGFMYADGCIYNKEYRMELSLQGSDVKHLQKFSKFLKSTKPDLVKIYHNYKQGNYDRCRISVRSKHLWESLNNKGCVPNKSLILTFPNNIPNDLIKHFIRGYIDGDGCLCTSNPYKIELNVLGTLDFLTGIVKNLPLKKDYPIFKVKNKNYYTLNLWCSTAINIIKFLYENSTIYLNRKYEKYLEVCRLKEESFKLLETNIGESCDANTEITEEIKEFSAS